MYIDAKRIVLPIAAVMKILVLAHTTHSGLSKTYELFDSRLAVKSRFFLKPVFQRGQGGTSDHVSEIQDQDQGEFHSSITPSLRHSSRLVEKL